MPISGRVDRASATDTVDSGSIAFVSGAGDPRFKFMLTVKQKNWYSQLFCLTVCINLNLGSPAPETNALPLNQLALLHKALWNLIKLWFCKSIVESLLLFLGSVDRSMITGLTQLRTDRYFQSPFEISPDMPTSLRLSEHQRWLYDTPGILNDESVSSNKMS